MTDAAIERLTTQSSPELMRSGSVAVYRDDLRALLGRVKALEGALKTIAGPGSQNPYVIARAALNPTGEL